MPWSPTPWRWTRLCSPRPGRVVSSRTIRRTSLSWKKLRQYPLKLHDSRRDDTATVHKGRSSQSELLDGRARFDGEPGVDSGVSGEGAAQSFCDQAVDHVQVVGAHEDFRLESEQVT